MAVGLATTGIKSVRTVVNHKFVTSKNDLSRKRRDLWLAAIKREDLTDSKIKYRRVCSRHFITGKPAPLEDKTNPDWVLSQNMGHSSQNVDEVERKARLDKRKIKPTRVNGIALAIPCHKGHKSYKIILFSKVPNNISLFQIFKPVYE